jgi:hypothetical protein
MLLASELARLKVELGYNALTLSALPYAFDGITAIFEQVVQPYLEGGTLTSSTTTITSQTAPTPATLTLATVVGVNVGDRLVVDQDLPQEFGHVQSISGSTVTLLLQGAHSGTYPVTVEGGESIARGYLRECILIAHRISRFGARAGVAKADEVEFFATTEKQMGGRGELMALQRYWRNELATCLGVENLRESASGSSQLTENY